MLVVDYQSKSYFRFLEDMAQIALRKNRFLITLNGASSEELNKVKEAFLSMTAASIQTSTAIFDKQSDSHITTLFSEARSTREMLLFEQSDLLFDKKTEVKNSHERDCGFNLNHLFKSIAKHNGVMILATTDKQTLSATMSAKVDVLIRFPVNKSA